MSTPNAFLITATDAEPVTHPLTLEALQASVGGYICPAFTVDGPDGHAITGYVNDEGAMYGQPVTILLNGGPLFGSMLITGLDGGGETVPLTLNDMDWIEERLDYVLMMNPETNEVFSCWNLTLRD